MNNLVSKNPVQRFKQGRKIQFAKVGDKFLYNGEEVIEETLNGQTILRRKNGTYVYPNNRNLTKLNGESYRKVLTAPQTRVFTNTDRYTPMPWKEPIIIEYDTNPNSGVSGVRVDWPNALNYSVQNTQTNQKPQNQDKSNSQKSAKTPFKQQKTNNIFIKGFQNRRGEIKDVRAMQQKLWDLGFLKGSKFGVDGKWGGDTEAAYQKYLNMKNIPYDENLTQTPESATTTPLIQPTPEVKAVISGLDYSDKWKYPEMNVNIPENYVPTSLKANRSDIREVIRRATGKGAYDFTGAQRKALRQYINGEKYNENDLAAFGNLDIFNNYKPGFYNYKKQGGSLLLSRNPVIRFKNRNFK